MTLPVFADAAMGSSLGAPIERHRKLLHAWQLAVLRYTVTLNDADRLNVLALAAEVDRLDGRLDESSLHFFRRTSVDLCAALLTRCGDADAVIRRFHAELDEPRLKAAFAAAAGIAVADQVAAKRAQKRDAALFRGLPLRK